MIFQHTFPSKSCRTTIWVKKIFMQNNMQNPGVNSAWPYQPFRSSSRLRDHRQYLPKPATPPESYWKLWRLALRPPRVIFLFEKSSRGRGAPEGVAGYSSRPMSQRSSIISFPKLGAMISRDREGKKKGVGYFPSSWETPFPWEFTGSGLSWINCS